MTAVRQGEVEGRGCERTAPHADPAAVVGWRSALADVDASVYLILLLFFLVGILIRMVLLAVPLYALELGASEVMLGSLVAAFVTLPVFLSFLGAMICDQFGRRFMIRRAFLFYAGANLVGMLAPAAEWLLLGQMVAGAGDLFFTVAGFTYLTEVVPEDRVNLMNSVSIVLLAVGTLIGANVAGYIAETAGFRSVFAFSLAVSVAAFCVSLLLSETGARVRRSSSFPREILAAYAAAYELLRTNEVVRLVPFVTGLGTLGWFTFGSSFYLDYLRQVGISTATIGFLAGLGSVALVMAPIVFFFFNRHVGVLVTVLSGLFVGGLGLAVIPALTSVLGLALVATVSQLGTFFRMPGMLTLIRLNTDREQRATSFAVNNMSWAVGAFIGGPFWGMVVRTVGLSNAFVLAGVGTMLAAAGLLVWTRRMVY